jgi:ppGpp synthetase/RelA/SpoT-type nucleotidyltranferase
MTDSRTIEDRLREEYFDLLPEIRRVVEHLEAEVRYLLPPIRREFRRDEQVVVTSRVKDCESAVDSLRRKQEGATFGTE